jgi:hypothetical protein
VSRRASGSAAGTLVRAPVGALLPTLDVGAGATPALAWLALYIREIGQPKLDRGTPCPCRRCRSHSGSEPDR